MSRIIGRRVWLKMENMQPGGSFKIRGIGRTMQEAVAAGVTRFIGSSGGNAGMAMAVAAKGLSVPVTIYIPKSTKQFMVDKLKNFGADVIVAGENWNEANEQAKLALQQTGTFLVHPYDQPDTWLGHSSLVDELQIQLKQKPGCVVSCIGGGGLVIGLLQGLERIGWNSVPVIAMETKGANCFAAAREAGKVVTLAGITSVATSLGALSVSNTLFEMAQSQPERLVNYVVDDSAAKSACVKFADDMRVLVEPACGAALSAVYSGLIPPASGSQDGDIVVVVCGGNAVTLDLINQWREQYSQPHLTILKLKLKYIFFFFFNV